AGYRLSTSLELLSLIIAPWNHGADTKRRRSFNFDQKSSCLHHSDGKKGVNGFGCFLSKSIKALAYCGCSVWLLFLFVNSCDWMVCFFIHSSIIIFVFKFNKFNNSVVVHKFYY
ncbi:hypothetical protein ACQKPX_11390, partial [Photobacterium sp. DNB23_23_1]